MMGINLQRKQMIMRSNSDFDVYKKKLNALVTESATLNQGLPNRVCWIEKDLIPCTEIKLNFLKYEQWI